MDKAAPQAPRTVPPPVSPTSGKHAERAAHPVPGLSRTQVLRQSLTGGKAACLPPSTHPPTWVLDLQVPTT